jgi:hypothetical protein
LDDFPNMRTAASKTQRSRILALLLNAHGGWVPSFELARTALQYNSRVKELRQLGCVIESRVEVADDGQRHSWFRLIPGVAKSDCRDGATIIEQPDICQPPLFDVTPHVRHRDDG